ncbi:MAG: DUF3127 domain-containing protein [Bacteroidota bacterium]
MTVEGRLIEIFETQNVTDSFRKREFVVEYAENPQYPEFIKFELIQANCDQLNDFKVDDRINISFNLKGRKWTDPQGVVKYFNSLQAWRIEKAGGQTENIGQEPPVNQEWMKSDFSEDDDLPF